MMHEPEKSDSAIVATKPANKAGQLVAEPVERRAGTGRNANQQSTCRAQNRESVSQALDRVRQAAAICCLSLNTSLAEPEISRFPHKERPHMPGSPTTPGWAGTRDDAPVHVAFRVYDHVGTRDFLTFAAQWLAYALPYRRFADTLANANARLGADADRYSFTVVDSHLLLFAGFDRRTISQDIGIKTKMLMQLHFLDANL